LLEEDIKERAHLFCDIQSTIPFTKSYLPRILKIKQ